VLLGLAGRDFHYEKQIPTCAIRFGRKRLFIMRNKYLPVAVLLGLAGRDSSLCAEPLLENLKSKKKFNML
jgi:hypothetical protein